MSLSPRSATAPGWGFVGSLSLAFPSANCLHCANVEIFPANWAGGARDSVCETTFTSKGLTGGFGSPSARDSVECCITVIIHDFRRGVEQCSRSDETLAL